MSKEVQNDDEIISLDETCIMFKEVMLDRLIEQHEAGRSGWDNKRTFYPGELQERIMRNTLHKNWVDVANLAMIAWNLHE